MTLIEKSKYKFLVMCAACLVVISSTIVPTYAIDELPSEDVSQSSESSSERLETLTKRVDDLTVQVSELTNTVQVLCGQMSQFMVTTIPEEGNQVVDISDESIESIAKAVTYASRISADYPLRVGEFDYYVPSGALDYPYWFVCVSGANYGYIYCFNELPSTTDTTVPDNLYKTMNREPTFEEGEQWSDGNGGSFDPLEVATGGYQMPISNFDIYFGDDLVHKGDFGSGAVKHYVTLITGFDDVTYEPIEIVDNSVTLPELTKDGNVFLGWFTNTDYTHRITSNYEFTEDMTLYAKWMDQPEMGIIHKTFFNGLVEVFKTEPVIYIFSLIGLIIVVGIIRKYLMSR